MLFEVENIKCGGCSHSIVQKLEAIEGVDGVQVDVESGQVDVTAGDSSSGLPDKIRSALLSMGYPEKGSVEGVNAVKAKATSYVSCAVGKFAS